MEANRVIHTPRLATLATLKRDVLPGYFGELPSDETLRHRLRSAGIPFIKTNRAARRGGGAVWWDIAAVDRYLRAQIRPGVVR